MYTVSQVKGFSQDGSVDMGCLTSACEGCHASLFCNNKDTTEFQALNPKRIEVQVGDFVELYMPPGRTIMSTVLVFALPLALFPLGYLALKALAPQRGDVFHALGGFAAMAVAFGVATIISVRNKRRLMPTITKIVAKAGEEASSDSGPGDQSKA